MPKHTDEHMQRLSDRSASSRRATKLARLIETSPPLEADQVQRLCAALIGRRVEGGAR